MKHNYRSTALLLICAAWIGAGWIEAELAVGSEPSTYFAKLDSRILGTRPTQVTRRQTQRVDESKTFMHAVAKPLREVQITSSTAGPIHRVMATEGTRVKKGQPLVAFDVRLTEARLGITEAELQRSTSTMKTTELELELAQSRFKNMAVAFRKGAATNVELMESQIRWQQAQARKQAAVDDVKQALESRKYAFLENELRTIVAPFDGTVVNVLAVPGQTPTMRDSLVHLVDTSKLRVDFYVPVSQLDEVTQRRERKEIRLFAEAPVNKQLTGKVVVIDNIIDPATQTVRCVVEIENSKGALPSGFRVRM